MVLMLPVVVSAATASEDLAALGQAITGYLSAHTTTVTEITKGLATYYCTQNGTPC